MPFDRETRRAHRGASQRPHLDASERVAQGNLRGISPSISRSTMVARMRWSFRVARLFGIDVRVHVAFALAVLSFALNVAAPPDLAFGALVIGALLAALTFHELSHCLVARGLGLDVTEILLVPTGAVARSASEPKKARQEVLLA